MLLLIIVVLIPLIHDQFVHGLLLMPNQNGGKPPLSYQSFAKLAGEPPSPLATKYSSLPPVGPLGSCDVSEVPTIKDLGYEDDQLVCILYFKINNPLGTSN